MNEPILKIDKLIFYGNVIQIIYDYNVSIVMDTLRLGKTSTYVYWTTSWFGFMLMNSLKRKVRALQNVKSIKQE